MPWVMFSTDLGPVGAPVPGCHFLDQKKVAKESAARGLFLVLLRSERKSGLVLPCAMGSICGLRRSQASAWSEVATFLIKRKWPKIDQGGPWTPSKATGCAGGLRLGPPLVSWPVPSLRSPPDKAVGSSAKRRASRGARQPGRAGARSRVRERSVCMALGCAPLSEYTTRAEKGDKILKAEG